MKKGLPSLVFAFTFICLSFLNVFSPPGSTKCIAAADGFYYNNATGLLEACQPGEYDNGTACVDCPAGFSCAGITADPQACVNHTYQDQPGQSDCQPCPEGNSCLNTSATPVPCNLGQYSREGSSICEACPTNYYSKAEAKECLPCPAGSSCITTTPTECASGTVSRDGEGICRPCPIGQHTDGLSQQSICKDCPAGSQCQNTSLAPVPCNDGEFSKEKDGVCSACPAGYFCANPANLPEICPTGKYSSASTGVAGCLDCPGGSSCENPADLPLNCVEGKYSLLGEARCLDCPAGSSCSDPAAAPVNCTPAGYFSSAGNGTCYPCPVGYSCLHAYNNPVKCSQGTTTHGLTGATSCDACPSGSSCADPSVAPVACASGSYLPSGASSCQSCPAGARCDASTATACDPGTYSLLGQSDCTGCPAGQACPYIDQARLFACVPGSYSLANAAYCVPCPPGSECPDTDKDITISGCSPGFYSYGSQESCTPCPAGKKCPQADGSQNVNCLPGEYSLAEATNCTQCTKGFACPYTNSDTMILCNPGTYSGPGQTVCTRCPAGNRCPATDTADNSNITPCDAGTYSPGGQATCTGCPAGSACPTIFAAFVVLCSEGTYSEANKMACTPCPAGQYCNSTTRPGSVCDDGFYSVGRQTVCTSCPAGFECSDKAMPPVKCAEGTYSLANSMTCDDCDAGYLCGEASDSATPADSKCPLGYFCMAGATEAQACPAGTFGANESLGSDAECTECPAGYFCTEGTAGIPATGNLCPLGHYCPPGTESANQYPCDPGTYGPNIGQEDPSGCIDCPIGTYCNNGTYFPGLPCPRGYYCDSKTGGTDDPKPPQACPAGTYTAEEGARTISACVDCPAGYYCESGTANPTPCYPGTFQPLTRQPSVSSCQECTAGKACTTTALTAPDSPCSPGYVCPVGTADPEEEPCPAGFYTDAYNLTSVDECDVCPPRFACPAGTGGTNKAPEICSPGYFCKNQTESSTQWPCPAGSYSNKTNLATEDECWDCPRGSWCAANSSSPQGPCPAGYFCPAGTKSATEYPCPSGSYTNQTGRIREEDCDDCLQGFYCAAGSSDPTACPPGSYNDASRSDGPEDCGACPAGYYCPTNGTVDPLPCGVGSYSTSSKDSCSPCRAGYYCDEVATSDFILPNKSCPAGTFCDVGTSNAPNLYNSSCPLGFYCVDGNTAYGSGIAYPTPCPIATYGASTGLKMKSDCSPCTEGSYCDQTNLTEPAGPCPDGHYCPMGTGSSTEHPCPSSTFLKGTAAVSSTSCTECSSGYYCPDNGTVDPIPCPPGSYCEPGASRPEPCDAGTYNNGTLAKNSLECAQCPGGKYCEGKNNTQPTGLCDAGFYCIEGSDTPTPSNGSKGAVCFVGGYCPEGSAYPTACESGFFVNHEKATSADECKPCIAGYYCSGSSATNFTGECNPGYYCTGGARDPTQHSTQAGYYSGSGATNQTLCPKGTYSTGERNFECTVCEAGQYCNETGMTASRPCPTGSYCLYGSIDPEPCPAGTYNDELGQTNSSVCNPCEAGYYCSQSGLSSSEAECEAGYWCGSGSETPVPNGTLPSGGPCPSGHYCPAGTKSAVENECDVGTFNNITHAKNASYCLECTPGRVCSIAGLSSPNGYCKEGYYCTGGANQEEPINVSWGDICDRGYYCPTGSASQTECPPGEFSNITKAASCDNCTASYQCLGKNNRVLCPAGHYCPTGTGDAPPRCPPGTYMDNVGSASIDDCKPCSGGFYCDDYGQTNSTKPCAAGYYCKSGVDVPDPSTTPFTGVGGRCPPGSYCPEQTDEPLGCPVGTYSNVEGAVDASNCTQCDDGKYCSKTNLTAPDGNCTAGFYCSGGATRPDPPGGLCPVTFYCPEGTPEPLECPPGGYSNMTGLPACTPCEKGYYCPASTVDYLDFPCPPGYYCPAGTGAYVDHPCPPGTYGTAFMLSEESLCTPCDPGKYCLGNGNTTVSGDCDPGFYCLVNSSTPAPSGLMNITSPDSCYCPSTDTGGRCPIGHFCPAGTGEPLSCTGGHYCEREGLSNTSGECQAGYYCTSNATRPDPDDGVTGGVCPAGAWCGVGTTNPDPCPRGTFSNGTGLTSISNCTLCVAGFYCPNTGQVDVSNPCDAGFYCPAGESTGNRLPCEPGYKCPPQSPDQVLCESGYYQDENQTDSCKVCPAGYYCDRSDGPIPAYTDYPCPEGSYCLEGTEYALQYKCPVGTYGYVEKAQNVSGCALCPAGKYCPIEGLNNSDVGNGSGSTYNCEAGYLCVAGASIGTPNDTTGHPCSKGHFCNPGVTAEANCPVGTFNNQTGQGYSGACIPCRPGFFCDAVALEEPSGPCSEGYYCPGGDQSPTPVDQNCTVGHYCPEQTANPLPCPEGQYNTIMGAAECNNCPAGRYCVDGQNQFECPIGFYCPSGTGYNWQSCPKGTYGHAPNLEKEEDCQRCDPGKYCDQLNATTYTGDCVERYYCRNGSDSATPTGSDGINGDCSAGHYCPNGTTFEEVCPPGTYSNRTGLAFADECSDCPAGMYCSGGLSEPNGKCSGGYFCIQNANESQPSGGVTGNECPSGFYCPSGSSKPKSCPAGRYNNEPGLEECYECMAGYYCPVNSTDYVDYECPEGYYCPNGTQDMYQFPCPAGTYGNDTRQKDLRGCLPCPAGYFCNGTGLTQPSGKCTEGWYCSLCSWSPTPGSSASSPPDESSCLCPVLSERNSTGGKCQPGFYCPEGSDNPLPCRPGEFCATSGLGNVTSGPCDSGFFCTSGASSSAPMDGITGNECPAGSYCEGGSEFSLHCPPGTFSNHTQNKAINECSPCTGGFFCLGGEATESGLCSPNYYCPGGQNVSSPAEYECEPGNSCPGGVDAQIPCESGTYQDLHGQSSCKTCPEGYYCEAINSSTSIIGVSVPQECLQGFYCLNGTKFSTQYGCPEGYYGNRTLLIGADQCNICEAGQYCEGRGNDRPSGPCDEGFYCNNGSSSRAPTDGIMGGKCPAGFYCPLGTSTPKGCSAGTFGPVEGLASQDNCTQCTGGMYCPTIGQTSPNGSCLAGYYCPDGSDKRDAVPCPVGYHCPTGSPDPVPCPPGEFTNDTLQATCRPCDQGSYCNGTTIQDCPMGYFCPIGTGATLEPCPRGTYGDTIGLHSEDQCKSCDPGYYCSGLHATTTTGQCDPGYYCRNGSTSQRPPGNDYNAGVCPPGYYCTGATGEPTSCDPGTFNSQPQAKGPDFCENCTAGSYCNSSGLDAPTGLCSEGFYCSGGSSDPSPSVATVTGGPCPQGSFCIAGSSLPSLCIGGSYAPDMAMPSCFNCPAGSFCPVGANMTTECPYGHYCPDNSLEPTPCTNGTYNNETGSTGIDACQYCPGGYFCPNKGMRNPEGKCAPGWYCVLGSWMERPTVVGTNFSGSCACPEGSQGIGGQCEPGEYCPEGSTLPTPCDGGYFCSSPGRDTVTGPCREGYYCSGSSQEEAPEGKSYGDRCHPGYYCPQNSSSPTPCPEGTFTGDYLNVNESNCQLCTAGRYCPSSNMSAPGDQCDVGFYCPAGSTMNAPPSNVCPEGTQCPLGSASPIPCYSGTYQPDPQQGSCLVCNEGRYCDYDEALNLGLAGVVSSQLCPPGFFCPAGTNFSTEHPCPRGTYSDAYGLKREDDCFHCDGGYYCDRTNQTSPTDQCFPGYYCPTLSASPTQNECPSGSYCPRGSSSPTKCPAGTYGASPRLGAISECTPCDPGSYCDTDGFTEPTDVCFAGYYCSGNSTRPDPNGQPFGDICPEGSYCPENSSQPILCPGGTFNGATQKTSLLDCEPCTAGYYCNGTGRVAVEGQCSEGFFCNGSASSPTENDCPVGHYCPIETSEPKPCLNGSYANTTRSAVCAPCPSGRWCEDAAVDPLPCPRGYYCPEGTGYNWRACREGTFNPTLGISSESECTQCTAGYYCETPGMENVTGPCNPGYDCTLGVNSRAPNNASNTGSGRPCQPGYQCPNGVAEACPVGFFARTEGHDLCELCDAGYYCDGGTIIPSECLKGHYCPPGTRSASEFRCPAGTFNNKTRQGNLTSCLSCTGGMYCMGEANEEPDDFCNEGYYCVSGSDSPTPEVTGITLGGSNETCSNLFDCVCSDLSDTRGGVCPPGYYCPRGSSEPRPCDNGHFCPSYGMSAVGGNCSAGFYCVNGSSVADQYKCEPGYYCETGTGIPTPCPPGTYSGTYQNKDASFCLSCTSGRFCEGNHNIKVTGNCSAGFYCPGGDASSSNPTFVCRKNYFCPEGSVNETVCPAGTYQPQEGREFCEVCEQGKYCYPYDGNLDPENCPLGFYCPAGTPDPVPCPIGTYGATDSRVQESECTDCPAGEYCDTPGATGSRGPCYAGYYCTGKATRPDPDNENIDPTKPGFTGNSFCPMGYYCENGTSTPTACPPGTFSQDTRRTNVSDCLPCPAGKYCDSANRTDWGSAPDCAQGYVCTGGASSPTPNDGTGYPCPKGYYCPAGTTVPLGCEPGTHSPNEMAHVCEVCHEGTYCPDFNTSVPLSCLPGFYCPDNTSIPVPCPEGTYNSQSGSFNEAACSPCPAHYYCNDTGNAIQDGPCEAGYLCEGGSSTPTPSGSTSPTGIYNGPCPIGSYCLQGDASDPLQSCPRGTLRNTTGGASVDDCFPCTGGYYCLNPGQSVPTDQCDCGFYCPGNVSNDSPNQYPCPTGHFCPIGSSQPRPCDIGTYQPSTKKCVCEECRPGYYCDDTLSGGQKPCPAYSYCPLGSPYPIPCPNGTYTLDTTELLQAAIECLPCPPGNYCTGGEIKGQCSAGYFCLSRAYSSTSNGSAEPCNSLETCAGLCPAGFYCEEGAVQKQPCPENTLRRVPGGSQLSDCEYCPAGYWCHEGNPEPDLCPTGFFCPGLNTSDCMDKAGPQPCPLYTYRNETGGSKVEDCLACPAGFWCNETNLSDYSSSACELGYYCVGGGQAPTKCPAGTLRNTTGATSSDDCSPCTPGYYCPDPITTGATNINGIPCDKGFVCANGAISETPCPSGFYCGEKTYDPDVCPGGFFCPNGSYTYTICEYPFYCPEGTGDPLPCDIGYQPLNISGLRVNLTEACMICPPGSYRNSSNDDKCQPCPPGYFCPEGTGNFQQNACPVGHYCPEGGITSVGGVTGAPIPCPVGYFGQQAGAEFSVCQPCAADMYNNKEGQAACFPCGSSATSLEGSVECVCEGFNRAFQASDGSCVCQSGFVFYNEADEIQSEGNSQFSCEAVVDTRCASGETRLASDRSCVTPAAYSCESTCSGGSGTMNVDLGTCLCDNVKVPEEIQCAVGCYSIATTFNPESGALEMVTTSLTDGSTQSDSVPGVFGPSDKTVGSTNTLLIQMSSQGIYAVPPSSPNVTSSVVNGTLKDDINSEAPTVQSRSRRSVLNANEFDATFTGFFGRRILQTSSDNSTDATPTIPTTNAATNLDIIPNPVICLQIGEMLIFGLNLDLENRNLSNYPVYVRNHLFNTNPNFDYGAFRQLESYVTQTNWMVTNFAHVFLEPGIYVFRDSQNPEQELIINVLANGLLCDASRMQPATIPSLTALGVAKQPVSNLTPDWVLIAVLLVIFCACVVVLVIAVIVWRPRDAGIFPMRYWMPQYRALGEPYVPPYKTAQAHVSHDSREGLGVVRGRGEAEGAEADVLKDNTLLEDFNVRTLYDKLEDQNLHLSSQMHKHQDSLRGFYEKISNQTEGLKKMLNKLDVSKLEAAELARSAGTAGASVVNTTVQIDGLHRDLKLAGGQSLREKELLQSLESLINKLNTGKITVSDEVINDARNRLRGIDSKEEEKKQKSQSKKGVQNDDDWRMAGQEELIRAQESDKIDLDRELIAGEREAITNLLITHDNQRKTLISDLNDKLAFRSQGELSEKEMNSLLAEHEKELDNALGALSRERLRQMNELKEQLAAKRRERARQLRKTHKDQCKEADIPAPSGEEGNKDSDDLSLIEKQLEAALLQESSIASKENDELQSGANKEEEVKLSKTFEDELDAMVSNGLISDEVREQLKRQILEQESALNNRMEEKRAMQFKAMRDRMAERKRRRMKKLEDQQEQEKQLAGEYTQEMKDRHSAEKDALEAELNAEEATMEHDMNDAIHSEHKEALKDLHREIINDMSEKNGVDPVAQQELLDRYRREVDNYDHVNGVRRSMQAQDLQAKLAARRARRAAEVQKSAEERLKKSAKDAEEERLRELARLKEEQEAARLEEEDGIDVPQVMISDNFEIQALAREQERVLAETDQQQIAEAEKLMVDLDAKEVVDAEALERRLREEKEKLLREAASKHEAEARARTDLSEEQVNQLLAAHQQELNDLEESLEKQQNRQRVALQEKMAARRKRKTAALKSRQEIEKQREQVEQKKEMAQVHAKTTKEAEKKAIIEGIERNGASASERVIQKVLEKRHAQELKNLEEEFALKKKMLIEEALKLINEQYQAERDAMLSKHEDDLLQLENQRLPTEEFERRKKELLTAQQEQLRALDSKHGTECKEIEDSTAAQWNLDFAQAKLKLKEQHYQEFAEALRELAPSASQQRTAEQAEESAKKLEETKQRLDQEREKAEKDLAEERSAFEEQENQRVALAMAEFEKNLEFETEQEKSKAEKTLQNLTKRKEKLLKDKRDKMREELERASAAGASEEEQQKILDQHEKDVENLTNKMDRERLRMKTQLEERLKKRRKEKLTNKKQELEKQSEVSQKEIEAKHKADLQQVQTHQIETLQQTAAVLEKEEKSRRALEAAATAAAVPKDVESLPSRTPTPVLPSQPIDDFPQMPLDPELQLMPYVTAAPPISESELHGMLSTSPLYQTLQEIRDVLNEEKKAENLTGAAGKFEGPDVNSADNDLIPTPLSDLNTREMVAYKFGTFIIGLLKQRRPNHLPINLLVAETVPAQPNLNQNAFRGSFCFDEGNGILYVKRARLTQDSIGRLSLLLVHVVAHIATGALGDDNSSRFIEEFYQCLAVLSDDLFFARYKSEPKSFEKGPGDAGKSSLSQDLLDVKLPIRDVSTPAAGSMRQRGLRDRIEKYAQATVTTMVREGLGNIESKFEQAKSSGTLDEVDAKLSALMPQIPSSAQSVRRPDTRARTASPGDDLDDLNAEFISLTRESDQLHNSLSSNSEDNLTVRNRLNNVQIRLSDVQRRLRSVR